MNRMLVAALTAVTAVAAFGAKPAMAAFPNTSPSNLPCGVSRVDRAGPISVRLYLRPSRSRVVYLLHDSDMKEIGPDVVRPVVLVQLGDKITSRYTYAVPRCSMAVTTTKGRLGLEVENKTRLSWPPDRLFIPAQ